MENAEINLSGAELGLRLVQRVAYSPKQRASRVTWHAHDCFEFLLALEGATAYEFAEGKTLEFSGGHFMVIAPEKVHRGLHDVRRPTALLGLMVDPSCGEADAGSPSFTPVDLNWMKQQFEFADAQISTTNTEMKHLTKIATRCLTIKAPQNGANLATLRWAVCGLVLEAAKQLASARKPVPQKTVAKAIEVMQSRWNDPCSIEHLARAVGCSRGRLFEVFKESMGMTPNDYWLRMRIDYAQKQLIHSARTINEIAHYCGFSTSQYFSNVFRRHFDLTPSAYRELFRQPRKSVTVSVAAELPGSAAESWVSKTADGRQR